MRRTVLFVDDNPLILKTIELAFAKEHYKTFFARNGEEALALVDEHSPQVIVTDLRMPGMNGLDLLRRARIRHPDFIGMIFTAYLDIDTIMEAVSDEAVWRYITKPWQDARELLLAVRNAFQYHEATAARQQVEEQLQRTERLAALGNLVSGIAHQFNNINVGIMAYVQMALLQKGLPTELRDNLEQVNKFAKRATEIVRELSNFSDQSAHWSFSESSLTDTVREALSFCSKELKNENIEVTTSYEGPCKAILNFGLVTQLMKNLIHNAEHATLGRSPRKITVETGTLADRVFVRVSDNGYGIAPEYISKVFDPFFTTKGAQAPIGSAQASVSGLGLGLSMAQTVAQVHNGELTVKSTPEKGTEFTFSLPAV